ncbi:MAG: dipeptide epimerase [Gammaproteobacteria bacterium]|nr:dipeptide epimerase [Gammaproteobacteria bacterium]
MQIASRVERWPLARPFTIARGSKRTADVVVAVVTDGRHEGRGECVPYGRYGHTVAGVAAEIDDFRGPFDRRALLAHMPPGPARNAIDCALWDFEAKAAGQPVWRLADVDRPRRVTTAFTISLDTVDAMGEQANRGRGHALLKVKLGSDDSDADAARLDAVRSGAPGARLIVDANEGWTIDTLAGFVPHAVAAGVELIEQPLPADADGQLAGFASPIPIAADESLVEGADLDALTARYQAVNIKLDKTGGLTRALALARQVQTLGLDVMVGCMVATSLAMAPALLLADRARFVDLDGPLLLARDRQPGLAYNGDSVEFSTDVWG